jgi:hypothetical protein
VQPNIDSEPIGAGGSDWQAIYIPPGVSAQVMNWQGVWSSGTTYLVGAVVNYEGRIWVSMVDSNFNSIPGWGNLNWQILAPWGGTHRYGPTLAASGTNNYNVALSPDAEPAAIYDGMRVRIILGNNNTGDGTTLKIGSLPAWPMRIRAGIGTKKDDFQAGEIYDMVFQGSSNEWLALMTPEQGRRLKEGEDLDVIYKPSIADNKRKPDYTYIDPPELDWPYPYATRGSLELRLRNIEVALGLYPPKSPPDSTTWEPNWTAPWVTRTEH